MLPIFAATPVIWAVAGSVGGTIIKKANKVMHDRAHDQGYRDGYVAASRVYEAKYRKLIEEFESDRNKLRREMNKYKQLCKELLEKCEEYERMGYSELADRAKNDYYRLRNAA
ncbi:MAG: hypothetical protein PUF61_13165 [Spirochaetales bacterium]|nr:hypothetical protein [Spirochaetales bacterium]